MTLGLNYYIAAKAGAVAEGAAGWINESNPLRHPVIAQSLLEGRFAIGQLNAVVDAANFTGITHLKVHRRTEHRHRVGEVELPLVVVGAELG